MIFPSFPHLDPGFPRQKPCLGRGFQQHRFAGTWHCQHDKKGTPNCVRNQEAVVLTAVFCLGGLFFSQHVPVQFRNVFFENGEHDFIIETLVIESPNIIITHLDTTSTSPKLDIRWTKPFLGPSSVPTETLNDINSPNQWITYKSSIKLWL